MQKELSVSGGFLNPFEKQPSQSSKTITQSFTDEFGSNLNNSNSKRDKARLKRGSTTQYLINGSPEEIVDNTLTGFVIKHIRDNGPQDFDTLFWFVKEKYQSLRKLSGHAYTGNIKKALKGTLTANGLFHEIKFDSLQTDGKAELQKDANCEEFESQNKQPIVSYWNIIENAVNEYLKEKIKIVSEKQLKMIKKSSYQITNKHDADQSIDENKSIDRFSISKPSIKSNREGKISNKKAIYNKLNSFINDLAPDEEEQFIGKKSKIVKQLTRNWNKANSSSNPLSPEDIPEQLLGALQLYAFFRDSKDSDPLKSLNVNLNKLSQCINKLNSDF